MKNVTWMESMVSSGTYPKWQDNIRIETFLAKASLSKPNRKLATIPSTCTTTSPPFKRGFETGRVRPQNSRNFLSTNDFACWRTEHCVNEKNYFLKKENSISLGCRRSLQIKICSTFWVFRGQFRKQHTRKSAALFKPLKLRNAIVYCLV